MLKPILGVCVMLGVMSVVSADEPKLKRFSFSQVHMGTEFKMVFYAKNEKLARTASDAAFARIAELDQVMSDYKKDSELMKLCAKAGGPPVKVSKDLFDVLSRSQKLAKKTDGAFDVTLGPVIRLWRISRKKRQLPNPERLKSAMAKSGHDKMRLDSIMRTVQLLIRGMLLDLGGIAKGYAAEAALAVLRRFGITHALVAAGGDVACADVPPGKKGWKVGIGPLRNPTAAPKYHLLLKNAATSTSGDVEQFTIIDGKRYSHIIDPKTGIGLPGRSSVTVIAPSSTTTDSVATAVSILDTKAGLKLVDSIPNAAVYIVREENGKLVETTSKRFSRYTWKEE